MTKDGVVYDLEKSPFIIGVGDYKYHFSSKKHLEKWCNGIHNNRDEIARSISKRFKVELSIETIAIADLALYRKIETRGFFVTRKGVNVCPYPA